MTMPLAPLDNLVRSGQLKLEPAARSEIDGLTRSGQVQWRMLDQAHRKRNLAEYEGNLEIDEHLLAALIRVAGEVEKRLVALGPLPIP
jgi:hypothetical protein